MSEELIRFMGERLARENDFDNPENVCLVHIPIKVTHREENGTNVFDVVFYLCREDFTVVFKTNTVRFSEDNSDPAIVTLAKLVHGIEAFNCVFSPAFVERIRREYEQ